MDTVPLVGILGSERPKNRRALQECRDRSQWFRVSGAQAEPYCRRMCWPVIFSFVKHSLSATTPVVLKEQHIDALRKIKPRTLQNRKVTRPENCADKLSIGRRYNISGLRNFSMRYSA